MAPKEQNKELSGNKGEWSEIYVFLRLLDTGKLNVADNELNAIPNEFYRILEIIRKETLTSNNYVRENDTVSIFVKNDETGEEESFTYPICIFAEKADHLLQLIKDTKGRSFQLPSIASFLKELRVSSIKDVGHNRDITIKIEDFHTGMPQTLGFSIKSFLGSDSTLFNAGSGTNFIYEVVLPEGTTINCDEFNSRTYPISGRLSARLKSLVEDYNASIEFRGVQSRCFAQNLEAIDGHMPQLLSQLLLISGTSGKASLKKCTELLTKQNPLGFNTQTHGNIYEYKVKRFLQDCAQGMTPETPWLGIYDATGGQIIVKEDGDIVCYHIYELNRFRDFLFNTTKFERASTSEDGNHPGYPRPDASKNYNYGWLYEVNGHYFIKINLQVRSK